MSDATSSKVDRKTILQSVGGVSIPGGVEAMVDAMSQRHFSVLRMHRNRFRDHGDETLSLANRVPFSTKPIDWYSLGLRVTDADARPSRHLAYAGGDYYLQDAGSLLALAAAGCDGDSLKGKIVCDLCAAPGGKASAMLEAVGETGFLLANEPIRSRLAPLKYNLARTGSDRYAISSLDPDVLAKRLGGVFDCVIIDAPCSGQALMSKGRQSESAMSMKQITHSAARQNRILDAAMALLRHDGRLIYSTCTFAHAENESQMQRLIERGDARPDQVASLTPYQSDDGCYRLWPHVHQCAGAFAAAFRSCLDPIKAKATKSGGKKSQRNKCDAKTIEELGRWFDPSLIDGLNVAIDGAVMFAYPSDIPIWMGRVAVAGPEIAYRTGKTWKPSHEAALRTGPSRLAIESAALSCDQAQAFVTGNAVNSIAQSTTAAQGWMVARYQGRPLGWVKSDGRIGKNHLPMSARMSGEVIG
ncbi:SAM-dependent methyltransferase [Rubripirellula amarantea]|nr:SAM-dependent methyltransferase [Rubripirellula amarantea]